VLPIKAAVYKYLNQIRQYDVATYMHCQRVANISISIGQGLTLNQSTLSSLYYSALLHDLGKVNISKGILERAEKLTSQEWEIIYQHPATGASMIQAEKAITENIIAGVLTHHERWNGKGYPYGLAGENIPLIGRIISIADALDAMTSARPYRRRPLLFDEAVSEIQSLSGQQFDPYIACALGDYILQREGVQPNV
jgi:HD-GYP domain-containing protein (c-di-GMP phosphodiesterase class II)